MFYIHQTLLAIAIFSIWITSFNVARAEDSDTLDIISSYELTPIEIKGIRINDHSPYAVSNVDAELIKNYNRVQDFSYLLDQTPSVHITSDAGAGVGYTGIRIRGTDDSRINFTINGIPVNNAESQQTYFVNIPDLLGTTHSIQIQRGVGASTNGTTSFGASVNMSNLALSDQPFAEFHTAAGSFKTLKNSISVGSGKLKGGFNFLLRLSKISSDGYIDRSSSDLKSLHFLAGWKSKNKKTSLKFNLLTGKERTGQAWNGVPEDSLSVNRRFNGLGLMKNREYYANQTDNYQQDYYQFFANHQFNQHWGVNAAIFLTRGKGYYDEYKIDEKFSTYNKDPYITPSNDTLFNTNLTRQLWLDNYFYGLTYSVDYKKNNSEFYLGGSITRYDGKHYGYVTWADYGFEKDEQWYHLTAYKNDYSLFAKWQQRIKNRLYIFGDLQYKHIHYTMNGFRRNVDIQPDEKFDFFQPKLGLSYNFTHKNQSRSKLFASFAIAQKEPNRDDFEASKHELPKHETLYDVELGYNIYAHKWQMSFNAYYMYYKDQLILTGKINDVGESTRENIPNSFRTGMEWSARYTPISILSLNANATLSKNQIKEFHEFIDDYDRGKQIENQYSKTDIAFSPNLIGYASVSIQPFVEKWDHQSLAFDLTTKYVSRQYLDNTSNKERSIDSYALANINIRYNISTSIFKEIGLNLALNNILNKKYSSNGYTFSYIYDNQLSTENYYFPQAGFNFLLGLQLKF